MIFFTVLVMFTGTSAAEVKVVEPCTGSTIALSCPQDTRIQVRQVLLADSNCYKAVTGECCPANNDCTGQPSDGHRQTVESRCNGQISCRVNLESKQIKCGIIWHYNDYERVKYECAATTTSSSTTTIISNTTTYQESNVSMIAANSTTPADDQPATTETYLGDVTQDDVHQPTAETQGSDDTSDSTPTAFVVPLIILAVAAVILVICYIRRKRNKLSKDANPSFSNPAYSGVTFSHVQNDDPSSQRNGGGGIVYDPIYELETATGRTSRIPLIIDTMQILDNTYSEVEFKLQSDKAAAAAAKPSSPVSSDYMEPSECNQASYGRFRTPAIGSPQGRRGDNEPLSPRCKESPIYSNVEPAGGGCDVYSEPRSWNENSYAALGMSAHHPESEYVPQSFCEYQPTSSAADPSSADTGVYWNMGRGSPSCASP